MHLVLTPVQNYRFYFSGGFSRFRDYCLGLGVPCAYGGEQLTERTVTQDHIKATAKGGTDTFDNIAIVCSSHNNSKGDKKLGKWMGGHPDVYGHIVDYLRYCQGITWQGVDYVKSVLPTFSKQIGLPEYQLKSDVGLMEVV